MNKDRRNRISAILAPAIGDALALIFEAQRSYQPADHDRLKTVNLANELEKYLTVTESAKLLRVHPRTFYELVYQNRIPYHKVGDRILFLQNSLIEWTASQAETDRSRRLRVVKS
jgi:excisionase family DNA binding protein